MIRISMSVMVILAMISVVAAEQVKAPRVNYPAGKYRQRVAIYLECDTPGAAIHYTLDGQKPSSSSAVFTGIPIELCKHASGDSVTLSGDNDPDPADSSVTLTNYSLRLRAMAVKAGYENSLVTQADYVLDLVDATLNIDYLPPPGAGGSKHQVDVYQPHGLLDCPVLLFVHGGAWKQGDKNIYMELGNTFAGYYHLTTVTANYQLSTDPWNAVHPTHIQDVAAAFTWVHDHIGEFGGDPNQIYLFGQSAGAHLVTLLATDGRYLQALNLNTRMIPGVIAMSGAYELSNLVQWPSNPYNLNAVETLGYKSLMMNTFGSWDNSVLEDGSPAWHIHAQQPPIALINLQEAGEFKDMPGFSKDAEAFEAKIKSLAGPAVTRALLSESDIPAEVLQMDYPGDTEGHYEEIYAINTRNWDSKPTRLVAASLPMPPAAPVLCQPAFSNPITGRQAVCRWSAISGAGSYRIQFSADPEFTNSIQHEAVAMDTFYSVAELGASRTYYWRVRAQNKAGDGPWSSVWNFITPFSTSIPAVPQPATWRMHSYPNPFSSQLFLDIEIPGGVEDPSGCLLVYDLIGRQVDRIVIPLQQNAIRTRYTPASLPDGIYFLRFEAAGRVVQQRVLHMQP